MEGGAVRIMSGKFCPPTYKVDLPFLLSASSLRRFDGPTEPDIMGIRLGLDIVCVYSRSRLTRAGTPRTRRKNLLVHDTSRKLRATLVVHVTETETSPNVVNYIMLIRTYMYITPSPCVACIVDASRQCALPPSLSSSLPSHL